MVGCCCDDVHRQEANYQVDYLDYDYEEDDYRFGRWERQLAS